MYNELRLAEAPYLSSLSLHWEAVVLMNLRIFVMERGTRRRQETKRQGMIIRERKVKTIESRDNIVFYLLLMVCIYGSVTSLFIHTSRALGSMTHMINATLFLSLLLSVFPSCHGETDHFFLSFTGRQIIWIKVIVYDTWISLNDFITKFSY